MAENIRAFTAARGELKINNNIVAYCTGVSGQEIVWRRAVRPIGQHVVAERPAVTVDVTWSANFVRLVNKDEVEQKLVGSRSRDALVHESEGVLELFDSVDNEPIYVIEGAVVNSSSFSMMSGDVVTTGVSGEGRRLLRESEIAKPAV